MPEFDLQFTLVLVTNGLMIGLMYALIALGFVLVYKATDAINFAQGEFVMFAAIIAAAAMGAALPFWLAAEHEVVGGDTPDSVQDRGTSVGPAYPPDRVFSGGIDEEA